LKILSEYETKIRRLLGKPFARALEKRKMLDVCYASNELLQENLPELWVTFRQYWEINIYMNPTLQIFFVLS